MPAPVLQVKRGALSNLPGLKAGEPAFTTDSFDFYVGIDSTTNNNKFVGSHRYWTKGTATTGSGVRLVERSDGGSNYIELKAPDVDIASSVTYVLPAIQGAAASVLTNDGSGNLSWGAGTNNAVFTGITTFSDTSDSTTKDNGAVVIEGGLGVEKSVNIGGNLSVAGVSTFVGNVTFQGGTINLGDSNTDDIVVAGEFKSDLTPTDDATYSLGATGKRWKDAIFSGIVTATTFSGNASSADQVKTVTASNTNATYYITFVDANNGSATNESIYTDDAIFYNPGTNVFTVGDVAVNGGDITTNVGTFNLINDTATTVNFAGAATNLIIGSTTGIATIRNAVTNFTGDIRIGGDDIQASDGVTAITLYPTTGNVGVSSNLTVNGNLYVLGSTTEVNTETLKVEDSLIEVGLVNSGGSLIPPTSDLNIDVGMIFHWYDTAARKAAIFWDDSTGRIVFADDISESSSVITVASNAYASIQIESLWVTDCAGTSQVISCSGTERYLNDITIDGGTF